MRTTFDVSVKPFTVPPTVQVVATTLKSVSINELDFNEIDPDVLSDMVDNFRKEVFTLAGKPDPKVRKPRTSPETTRP